jgi:hypothetical protein
MKVAYIIDGTLSDAKTIVLDQALSLGGTNRVRVIVEPIEPPRRPALEVLEEIHEAQRQRGFQPPTQEEVDAYLREERDSWGEP